MINNSFINKLKDFSSFNPSGNKGKERTVIMPLNQKRQISISEEKKRDHLPGLAVGSSSGRRSGGGGSIVLISGRYQDL